MNVGLKDTKPFKQLLVYFATPATNLPQIVHEHETNWMIINKVKRELNRM